MTEQVHIWRCSKCPSFAYLDGYQDAERTAAIHDDMYAHRGHVVMLWRAVYTEPVRRPDPSLAER